MLRILFHLFTDPSRAPLKFRRKSVKVERNGFTLVEMMVTLFILALLTTIVAINVLPNQDVEYYRVDRHHSRCIHRKSSAPNPSASGR